MNVCPGPTPLYHSSAAHRCHLGVVGEVRSSRRVCDIELGSIGKRTHNPNRDLFADGRNQQVRVSVHRDRRVARFHVDGHGLGLNIASRSYSHCSEMVDARVNCGRNCLQELIRMRSGLEARKKGAERSPNRTITKTGHPPSRQNPTHSPGHDAIRAIKICAKTGSLLHMTTFEAYGAKWEGRRTLMPARNLEPDRPRARYFTMTRLRIREAKKSLRNLSPPKPPKTLAGGISAPGVI